MSIKKISIKPPHGVSFTQSIDGTITFNYTLENSTLLRDVLIESCNQIIQILVNELETKKAEEEARRQIPLTTTQIINNELKRIKEENKIINPNEIIEDIFKNFQSDDLPPNGHSS